MNAIGMRRQIENENIVDFMGLLILSGFVHQFEKISVGSE